MSSVEKNYPVTPDGRYFVVRGRLWRCSNPALLPAQRQSLVQGLMAARRAKGFARRRGDVAARMTALQQVEEIKQKLGERGPVWWTDGSPDWNRHLVKNTPYASWWAQITGPQNDLITPSETPKSQ
ncbi:MAG: hypothetical protein JOY85_07310 [Acidobacteriaceae bacterium]|nr:hypothetical protein [Acidobacteriaceae bacterium]